MSPGSRIIKLAQLAEICRQIGLQFVGIIPVSETVSGLAVAANFLADWQQAGCAAELGYMQRDPELYKGFNHILPGAKTVIQVLVPYSGNSTFTSPGLFKFPGEAGSVSSPRVGYARVARYAWGRDYHQVLKSKLRELLDCLASSESPARSFSARIFSDAVPILERSLAAINRLGFIGKNSMLITPGIGSYYFIAEIVTDLDVDYSESTLPRPPLMAGGKSEELGPPGLKCRSCQRCMDSCPTGAITGPGVLDARRCISYLTIEKRGAFSEWERRALGEWVFGCDLCQEVCPFNHRGISNQAIQEFLPESGVGAWLCLQTVLSIRTESKFAEFYQGTPLMRPGRINLLRNAAAVAANLTFTEATPLLVEAVKQETSEVVKDECLSAIVRLLPDLRGTIAGEAEELLSSLSFSQASSE